MTISKAAWNSFLAKYRRCIEPNESGVTREEVEKKKGIRLCVNDILAQIRGTSRSFMHDREGQIVTTTCIAFLNTIFRDVFVTLNTTDVEVYVVCIDAYGMRPAEKTATAIKRAKRAKPEEAPAFLPIPEGQTFYFLDHQPMPGDMNMIFDTPAAKMEFYEYMTQYFLMYQNRERIPPGKCIIFSGGLQILEDAPVKSPPLRITSTGFDVCHEWESPHVREGDIDVWTWVYRFPDMDFHVHSYDADVVLIGMLQMRRLLKKYPTRRGWVITRRSIETQEVSSDYVQNQHKRQCLRKQLYDSVLEQTQDASKAYVAAGGSFAASSSSSDPPTAMRRPTWVSYHIDMVQVYLDIIKDAIAHGSTARIGPNFVENYVLAFILSSDQHDYIQTKLLSRNIGSHFVWMAFEHDKGRFGGLVEVFKPRGVEEPHRVFYYAVDRLVLADLVCAAYREKAEAAIKPDNKTPGQLEKARETSYVKSITKYGPSEDELKVVAAQCAWLLQYWGNGPIPNHVCVDGTEPDEDGNSVYGFTPSGWAATVAGTKPKRVCPPIIII